MNARKVFAPALVALALGLPAVHARQARDQMQAPKTGTAAISGVILTDESTPQPIKRATVMVINAESAFTKTVYTNDTGRFSLTGLPAGRYTMTVNKPAFLRVAYGAKRYDRPGTPITLKEGAQLTDITMRMPRGAVLGGVISDENGQPAFGVSVRVMQVRVQNGERTFVPVASGNLSETTDDRGSYRFFGLPPGEFVVSATPRMFGGEVRAMTEAEIRAVMQALQQQQQAAAQQATPGFSNAATPQPQPAPKPETEIVTVGFANVFYPGTTVPAQASAVTLGQGEERMGVDFPLRLVRTAKLEGTVLVPAGVRPQNVQLLLTPASQAGSSSAGLEMLSINRTSPDAEGKFVFTAVPPGQYTIVARATAGAPGQPPPPPPPPPPPGVAMGQAVTFSTVRVAPPGSAGEPAFVMNDFVMAGGEPGGATYWGQMDVSVDGMALSGLAMSLQPGMTVTGKITFKATRLIPDPDLSRARLTLSVVQTQGAQRISLGVPVAQVEPNGQFRITGVTPGRYRLNGAVPLPQGSGPGPGWTMLSAVAKGQDVLDFAIDIGPNDEIKDVVVTFTDSVQEVNGSLQDATGRPAPDYTIVVFAADSRFWTTPSRRVRSTRPGTDGKFAVPNLPPGEYRIAAVVDVAPGEVNDPAFLEQLVGASVKITLAEGERKTQDLRIAGGL